MGTMPRKTHGCGSDAAWTLCVPLNLTRLLFEGDEGDESLEHIESEGLLESKSRKKMRNESRVKVKGLGI
jgi:hypothetical protein